MGTRRFRFDPARSQASDGSDARLEKIDVMERVARTVVPVGKDPVNPLQFGGCGAFRQRVLVSGEQDSQARVSSSKLPIVG